jgi:hypothetical protein
LEDIKEERSITKRYSTDGYYRGRNNNRVKHSRLGNTTHTNSIKGQRMKTYKQFLEEQDIPKGHHRMPDGSIMKNSDHSKKKDEENIEEVSAAMRALRRRNAKSARAKNTIAKYGQAAKMGIPASQVNQRRTAVTRKKI